MGTNLEKVNYLKDTKGLFKERLNSLGANILQNTTFRNYLTWLDDLYTSISAKTITNTKCLYGNTTQTGTPTPSSPIPIDVITGRQEIQVCGKNLFDKDNVILNKRLDSSGNLTVTDNNYCTTDYFIGVEVNTTYYSSTQISGSACVCCYDINKNHLQRLIYLNTNTFTTPNNTAYIKVSLLKTNLDIEQIEKGSATSYEAYNGNTYEINLGKNLFNYDYSNLKNINRCTTTEASNGFTLTSTGVAGYGFASLELDNSVLGKEITISMTSTGNKTPSGRLFYHNANGTLTSNLGAFWTTNNKKTVSIPSELPSNSTGLAIVFYISQANNTSGDYATFTNIQVELGSQATSFAEYFTPIELCKIGDYQDRIYKQDGNWYLEKKIGKVVLNGTETGWWWNSGNNRAQGPLTNAKTTTTIYSNYFKGGTGYNDRTVNSAYIYDNNYIWIYLDSSEISSLNAFKTWLGTHNTTVYYVLATPTTEEITNDELISQLNEIEIYTLLSDDLVS